jgi:endothelin-converting enzyme/putative endopeptidase
MNFVPRRIALAPLALAFSLSLPAQPPSGVDLKAMDTTANPCSNFYQYACGTWRKDNPIPADRSRWSRFNELAERNQKIEREILEKAAAGGANRTPVEQKIGDYYAACMDEKAIDAKGVQPLEPLLKAIRGTESVANLDQAVALLHANGVRALFGFGVAPDRKNVNENIANVMQGGLGLPERDYYLRTDPKSVELLSQYEEHVRSMMALLAKAEGRTADDSATQARAIVRIETALAKASLGRVAMRNPDSTYHILPLTGLADLAPDFAWKQYFTNVGLPPIQKLNVGVPDFFKTVNTLLKETPLEDWKTYLTYHAVDTNATLLSQAFDAEDFRFHQQILSGVKEQQPRWKRCVSSTDRALGEALGQKFVEVAFSGASKTKTLQLVGEIEAEMGRDIKDASWMSPGTKDQALTKLAQVSNKIGYPDQWKDYTSVSVTRSDFFGDSLRARKFELKRNLDKLGKPVDKSEWGMTPGTVNAYYAPPMNNINFPAGILQPPFYNPKASEAVNYGAIGVVIGHELTHGFDDQGRRFDGAGNLRDWWSAADAKEFEHRADCVVNEYTGFSPVSGVNLNGKLTLGENAADNGGIHLAYMALMDALAKRVLPKLDGFTPQQQFFLGYAQIWCENSTEQSSRLLANTDPHSPGQFRVNGVLQNLPEFAEAYSCKTGDAMVVKDPCRVW